MTAQPFVAQLRARGTPIQIGQPGAQAITVRVEMPEVWDTVKAEVSPNEPVLALKVKALEVLYPTNARQEEFVLKLNGWEVLDENATLAAAGAVNGSIFVLTYRRRRPVR
jgi:hypothetical protein